MCIQKLKRISWQDKQLLDKRCYCKQLHFIRFADVILMLAEAEVEIGALKKQDLVNEYGKELQTLLDSWLQRCFSAPNYKVGIYTTPWVDKAAARTAVRFERKLELALEGHRFFDLVRWGTARSTMDNYFRYVSGTIKSSD